MLLYLLECIQTRSFSYHQELVCLLARLQPLHLGNTPSMMQDLELHVNSRYVDAEWLNDTGVYFRVNLPWGPIDQAAAAQHFEATEVVLQEGRFGDLMVERNYQPVAPQHPHARFQARLSIHPRWINFRASGFADANAVGAMVGGNMPAGGLGAMPADAPGGGRGGRQRPANAPAADAAVGGQIDIADAPGGGGQMPENAPIDAPAACDVAGNPSADADPLWPPLLDNEEVETHDC